MTALSPLISTGAGKGTLPFGIAVTPNGATAYVAGQDGPGETEGGSISAINLAAGTAAAQIEMVGAGPVGVAITPDGSRALVANENLAPDNVITPISTATRLANGGPTPRHTYAKPGKYTAILTVTDNEGCSTKLIFTGQTASCNGSGAAAASQAIGVPPQTKIKKRPAKRTDSDTAEFKFKANEKGASFR